MKQESSQIDLEIDNSVEEGSPKKYSPKLLESMQTICNIFLIGLIVIIASGLIYHEFVLKKTIHEERFHSELNKKNLEINSYVQIVKNNNLKTYEENSNKETQIPIKNEPVITKEIVKKEQVLNNETPKKSTTIVPKQTIGKLNNPKINYRARYAAYSQNLRLNDFTTDSVYKNAPEDIKKIFDEMIKRPVQYHSGPSINFVPSEKAYYAYNLYKNPENKDYLKAEYYYLNEKYNISSYFSDQLKICIVAPGRNLVTGDKYKRFINSINSQNYSNYKLVYIDDVSEDGSADAFENYIKESEGILKEGRFTIVRNSERKYALGNRNEGIRNHCDVDSIVVDVDADDSFVGRQVFSFLNTIYHDKNVWQFNSVFVYDDMWRKEISTGPQDGVPAELLEQNRYRGSLTWKTSELRTFKAALFMKINENDFKNSKGQYYKWASDAFMQTSLVELAGPTHYKHIFEILYFYDWSFNINTVYKRRHYRDIAFMQTPYKPLESLDSAAQKEENYVVNEDMRKEYEHNIVMARQEAQNNGQSEELD